MNTTDRQNHWNTIYQTKSLKDVSWYQPKPETSLNLIHNTGCSKNAKIIDIGGGDSFLVDHLLEKGYTNITVLDISAQAIERAKARLGHKANAVHWIVADIAEFIPTRIYDIWHDRAAFHFLTDKNEINNYKSTFNKAISNNGALILGTFSDNGPLKCSGIPIKQYSKEDLIKLTKPNFKQEELFTIDHTTPFESIQNFVFGRFLKQ